MNELLTEIDLPDMPQPKTDRELLNECHYMLRMCATRGYPYINGPILIQFLNTRATEMQVNRVLIKGARQGVFAFSAVGRRPKTLEQVLQLCL